MIELARLVLAGAAEGLLRRRRRVGPFDRTFGAGTHGIVEPRLGRALGDVLGGLSAPAGGTVRVFGAEASSPKARGALTYIPFHPLGAPLSTRELVAGAARLRGEEPVTDEGPLKPWLARRWDELSLAERRTVLLATAIESRAVRAIVIHEPRSLFVTSATFDPLAGLRRWAAMEGRVLIGITASRVAAARLGGDVSSLAGEQVVPARDAEAVAWISTPDPAALSHLLTAAVGILRAEVLPGGVRATSTDPVVLARAIQEAIRTSGVAVEALEIV